MDSLTNKSNRIIWVDIAKGIGIILVIIGHALNKDQHIYLRGLIYSFHMPLYFILAGYTITSKPSLAKFRESIKKRVCRLIFPALVCYTITSLSQLVILYFNDDFDLNVFICNHLLGLFFCEGMDIYAWNTIIPGIGILWFFFAMFFSFSLFYFLHLVIHDSFKVTMLSIIVSIIGYFIVQTVVTIPFSIEISFLLLPFFSFGQYILPKINLSSVRVLLISCGLWLIMFLVTFSLSHFYFEIVPHCFPFYPICIITAIGGSVFVFCISKLLTNIKYCSKLLSTIGKNSLYILIAHVLEELINPFWLPNSVLTRILRSCIFICIVASVIVKVKHLFRSRRIQKET